MLGKLTITVPVTRPVVTETTENVHSNRNWDANASNSSNSQEANKSAQLNLGAGSDLWSRLSITEEYDIQESNISQANITDFKPLYLTNSHKKPGGSRWNLM